MQSSLFNEHLNRGKEGVQKQQRREKKDMLVRARQLELEKRCSACLEEGQTGGGSATSEDAALRCTVWRENKDTPVRAMQLEREEERKRGK